MYSLEHRPFSFDEMIGNKAIMNEMKKRSLSRDYPEVMIFAGPTGTGKTTLALMVAALINDPNPVSKKDFNDPNPESASSKAVLSEKFNRDIIFYDASSMGKEDVLNLESVVSGSPMFDRKKVIIIDEAQELTKAGKGVTLKLLEKKRKNAHIILCTMDLTAFDPAVKSRGQLYQFRSPGTLDVAKYLFSLVEKLAIDVPDEFIEKGLFLIADNYEGSVRYAVQNLERCIAGEIYTEEEIVQELGFISHNKLASLILRVLKKDVTVVKDIAAFSVTEFFYKTQVTLLEAYIYNTTGYFTAEWKKPFAEEIKKYEYDSLIDVFQTMNQEPYFKENVFLYKLAKFMKKASPKRRVPVQ